MANLEQIVEELSTLSVMEAAELAGMLEEKWGVSAVAVAAPVATGVAEAAPAEEKTDFDVILINHGEKKINVIKEVRALTGLSLGDAKGLVESGGEVLKGVDKAKSDEAKAKLEAAGATVEVK